MSFTVTGQSPDPRRFYQHTCQPRLVEDLQLVLPSVILDDFDESRLQSQSSRRSTTP